ncbi:MAG: SDR family NAD(P)-dependent oxidoreductase [Limisphaerales bacterium]
MTTSPPNSDSPVGVLFGATGGIGSELARRLTTAGWRLSLHARTEAPLTALAQELSATSRVADATDPAAVGAAFQSAMDQFGRVDAVAHCVGSLLLKPAHSTSDAEWQQTISQNLTTAFNVVRAAVPVLRTRGGSIVLVSSVAARRGLANHEAIAAAKAGIIGLTLAAAASYARQQIRVNCVAPGLTRTPLAAPILRSESALKYSTALHPLGRIGEPADVASAIAWLMQPEQSWLTGQVLGVDGGLVSVQPTLALGA